MARRPTLRRLASLALAVMVALQFPVAPATGAPAPLAVNPVPLSLWMHGDLTLSMAFHAQTETPPAGGFTTPKVWVMTDGLQKDLCIEGVDIGGGRQGFNVVMPIGWGGGFTASQNLTIRVKDDSVAIAEGTFALAWPPGSISSWPLNFTSARTSCMVLHGHKLSVEISSVVTGAATAQVGNIQGAHLAIAAVDPLLPAGHTENRQGPATAFFPNDLDGSREVLFNGTLGNAFTSVFIAAVRISIKDPAQVVAQNATATVSLDNWTYTWSYPRSPGGRYTVDIQVEDTQGNLYNTSTFFDFVGYGLRLDAQGAANGAASRYTTQGLCAAYELNVTNVGGNPTTALMLTEAAPPPLWSVNFTRTSLPLEAGASGATSFNACPAGQLGPGNSSQVTVIALANDDPAAIKARATLATTTIIEREIFLVMTPPATDASVKLGGLASYSFTITNNGGLPTDVLLDATAAPEAWTRSLTGPGEMVVEGSGWRLPGLAPGGSAALVLDVQAPASATPDATFACTVTGRSVENASAVATFVATTHLVLGIEISQTTLPVQPEVGPGEFFDFQFELRNTDPLADHTVNESDITVVLAVAPAPAVGNPPATLIQAPSGCCPENGAAALTVTLTFEPHTRAGRYQFTVNVMYDGDPAKVASLNFSILVRQVTAYSLVLDGKPSQVLLNRTGATHLHGALVSLSNYPVSVDLEASVLLDGAPDATWTVRLLDANLAEMPGRVVLQPYAELRVTLSITASPSALNGEHRDLSFRIALALTGQNPWTLAPVDLVVDLDTMSVITRMWQQSFLLVFLFLLLALVAASMARRALRGPAPPRPAAPKPGGKPAAAAAAPDKGAPATSKAGPPKT